MESNYKTQLEELKTTIEELEQTISNEPPAIETLVKKVNLLNDQFVNESSERKKLSRNWFISAFLSILFLMIFSSTVTYNNRIYIQERIDREIKSLEDNYIDSLSKISQENPTSDNIINARNEIIDKRLEALESFPIAINNLSQNTFQQINFVFGITATFFAIFSAFLGYRQLVLDNNKEKNDEKVNGLLTTVNQLMQTIKDNYSDQQRVLKQIEELTNISNSIQQSQEEEEQALNKAIVDLNDKAIKIFKGLNRQNFKSEENKSKLESFYDNMNSLQSRNIAGKINPFCYFVTALHLFNEIKYDLASTAFETANSIAKEDYDKPTVKLYAELSTDQITQQIDHMLKDCNYRLGLIYYNWGEGKYDDTSSNYGKAIAKFQETWERSKKEDYESLAYIPELMFFQYKSKMQKNEEVFKKVITKFDDVEKELNRFSEQKLLAYFLMKKGNCYLEEKPKQAFLIYAKAYQIAKTATLEGLKEIFIRFSLAQALDKILNKGKNNWLPTELETDDWQTLQDYMAGYIIDETEKNDFKSLKLNDIEDETWQNILDELSNRLDDLFQGVFNDIRRNIPTKTEPILLVLLNYTLAISAIKSSNTKEIAQSYIAKSYEYLQSVPNDVCIFSPLNKVNLKRNDFIKEMNDFEEDLFI